MTASLDPGPTRRLLVVDDEPIIANLIEAITRRMDPDVVIRVLHGGQEAQALAADFQPHLILLDVKMPDVDGFEVRRRLLGDGRTQRIPVVVMTGYDTPEILGRIAGAGVSGTLRKPLEVMEVREVIKRFIFREGP